MGWFRKEGKTIVDVQPVFRLFDTHCHLDFEAFADDFSGHLQRAGRKGVERLMIPAIGIQNWQRVLSLVSQYPSAVFCGLGIHPYFIHSTSDSTLPELAERVSSAGKNCVAIGECGLDGVIDVSASLQERIFLAQVELANEARLPLILHSRKTHERLIALLRKSRFSYGGVLHAFSGSEQQAKAFIDLGFKIGVGGVITYPRAKKTRRTVSLLPGDSIVIETDAPDMPVCGFQGEPNHPELLVEIFHVLARLRAVSPGSLAEQLWENSHQIFGLNVPK